MGVETNGAESKYKPEYCQMVIDHMAQGLSLSCFGATVGVVRSTVYLWQEHFPEFKNAVDEGFQKGQKFFEQRLMAKVAGQDIKGVDPKKIDNACLIFALKTRFHRDYSERNKVDISSSDGTMSPNKSVKNMSKEELELLAKILNDSENS